MKVYLVGGAVRDQLLGLPVKERDYVVVGANPALMQTQGFKPVGRDFPVFLHPTTHAEYALARTERKVAQGHQGFQFYTGPTVTLEEDLCRRDLTINAIAQDETTGALIDPYQGQVDLKNRILRHVSDAFTEDPLRILRVARFRAYLGAFDFKIADASLALMRSMVKAGQLQELSHERIWQEMSRALETPHADLFFQTLKEVGALPLFFPALTIKGLSTLSKTKAAPSLIRFAALTHEGICQVKVPKAFADLALIVHAHHAAGAKFMQASPEEKLALLHHLDYLRRASRLHDWIEACCPIDAHFPKTAILNSVAQLKTINRQAIATSCCIPTLIQNAIAKAELQKLLA